MPGGLIVLIELFLSPASVVLSKCCGLFFLSVVLDHALECALEDTLEDTLEFALENTLELSLQSELNYTASGCSLDAHWMCPANVQSTFLYVVIQSFVDASVACHFFLD